MRIAFDIAIHENDLTYIIRLFRFYTALLGLIAIVRRLSDCPSKDSLAFDRVAMGATT